MLTVRKDMSCLIVHRADYIRRMGSLNAHDFLRMGDGDIVFHIHPEAYKDVRDAQEICEWIESVLTKRAESLSDISSMAELLSMIEKEVDKMKQDPKTTTLTLGWNTSPHYEEGWYAGRLHNLFALKTLLEDIIR